MVHRHVIALDYYCIQFLSAIFGILKTKQMDNDALNEAAMSILTESTNQFFDIITVDIQDFSLNLLTVPNLANFDSYEQFQTTENRDIFVRHFREYAMALLVLLRGKVVLNPEKTYYLEQINSEYMIICETDER